jgi:hypothetical protein
MKYKTQMPNANKEQGISNNEQRTEETTIMLG